jgi:hypothetical protein
MVFDMIGSFLDGIDGEVTQSACRLWAARKPQPEPMLRVGAGVSGYAFGNELRHS